jgi:hypothetical protein
MERDLYDKMRLKTDRLVALGLKMAAEKSYRDLCQPDCASCLAAEARTDDDEVKGNNLGFAMGDVCMLEARSTLKEKLNWNIY